MSIEFECECGKTIRVKDDAAGRKIRCPSCDVALRVPDENDDSTAAAVTAAPSRKPPPPSFEVEDRERKPPKPRRRTDDDEEDDDRPRKSRRRDDDDDEEDDDDRPRKRRRRRRDDDDDYARPPTRSMRGLPGSGYSAANAGATLAAGILMMVGAVVWFALGLVAGIIFFYPPVLFILGIVAACRGVFQLMNSDH